MKQGKARSEETGGIGGSGETGVQGREGGQRTHGDREVLGDRKLGEKEVSRETGGSEVRGDRG